MKFSSLINVSDSIKKCLIFSKLFAIIILEIEESIVSLCKMEVISNETIRVKNF